MSFESRGRRCPGTGALSSANARCTRFILLRDSARRFLSCDDVRNTKTLVVLHAVHREVNTVSTTSDPFSFAIWCVFLLAQTVGLQQRGQQPSTKSAFAKEMEGDLFNEKGGHRSFNARACIDAISPTKMYPEKPTTGVEGGSVGDRLHLPALIPGRRATCTWAGSQAGTSSSAKRPHAPNN